LNALLNSFRFAQQLISRKEESCKDEHPQDPITPINPGSDKNNYQLVSRILFLNYHLSGPGITDGILLPTLQHRADRPQALVYVALQHARFTHEADYSAPS